MPNKLTFKISSALKNIIGRDLITDDFIAVFELVKNSYDAYAATVKIIFEEDKIIIQDDGKGMSYDDLKNKWLFVAYSAKKEGVEDENIDQFPDYRQEIKPRKYYAGAKGVGRFSCDRLGGFLRLITKQPAESSKIDLLEVDWGQFEQNSEDEFVDISVSHSKLKNINYSDFKHGTILEISKLNSNWNRNKIRRLKHSLEKLINPFQILKKGDRSQNTFSIFIEAKEELENDEIEKNERNKINGPVQNFIFETLNVKTTQIITEIDDKGEKITTKLIDRGMEIYKIEENNEFKIIERNKKPELLSNVSFHLFYLNRIAKLNFTNLMGVAPVRFGSVFLYRNGFRVYPYGEPDRDVFEIDVRKAQGHYRFLGTRDLLGRIEIVDEKEWFRETSSRDGGLIRNEAYEKLRMCFIDKCLHRLERYVVDIQWALKDSGDELNKIGSTEGKVKIIDLISDLTDTKEIKLLSYNKDIADIIKDKIGENLESVFEQLKKIASDTGDENYLKQIDAALTRYTYEAEARKTAERELEDTLKENLFLKSLRSESFEQIVSLMHQVSISASTNENYLNGLYKRLNLNVQVNKNDLKEIIETITLENKKIMSVAKFATKANFKMFTEEVTENLVEYIEQYVFNVLKNVQSHDFKIKVRETRPFEFVMKIRPIEINIIIDNMLSNSKKAGAKNFEIRMHKLSEDSIEIRFIDDGEGISKSNLEKIFSFGFTTSSGSGLGLFHVRNIVQNMNGTIQVNPNKKEGAEFILVINKLFK